MLIESQKLELANKNFMQDIKDFQLEKEKLHEEIVHLKEIEKQLKISHQALKNSSYANEKNWEVELEGVRELMRKNEVKKQHQDRESQKVI